VLGLRDDALARGDGLRELRVGEVLVRGDACERQRQQRCSEHDAAGRLMSGLGRHASSLSCFELVCDREACDGRGPVDES